MATKLHVTQQEMNRAYSFHKRFYAEAEKANPAMSRYLILCYAVECGLKSRLMRDRNLRDTNQMDNYTDETGQPSLGLHHNLARYLKEAKLPAQTIPPPLVLTDYRTKHSRDCRPSQVVQPHQYHEAFRYSVELEEEPHLITQLTRILQALEAS